jgi:hypothetical protein
MQNAMGSQVEDRRKPISVQGHKLGACDIEFLFQQFDEAGSIEAYIDDGRGVIGNNNAQIARSKRDVENIGCCPQQMSGSCQVEPLYLSVW